MTKKIIREKYLKRDGRIPEGLEPPELDVENDRTLRLWEIVSDQVRVTGMGEVFALDKAAILEIFERKGVEEPFRELEKMQLIFETVHNKNNKD